MDELTHTQLEQCRASLQALRETLTTLLDQTSGDAKPVDLDLPIGRLSRMDAIAQQSMAVANRAATERQLNMVNRALAELDEGDYGLCRECDEPIGFRRLRAKPETPYCLECQAEKERR